MKRGQADSVLAAVSAMKNHPTADEIYDRLRQDHPRLSLGTVYRNLKTLSENGGILKIQVPGGKDRFDFRLDRHEHMICDKCERAFDINAKVIINIDEPDIQINGCDIIFHGICAECMRSA